MVQAKQYEAYEKFRNRADANEWRVKVEEACRQSFLGHLERNSPDSQREYSPREDGRPNTEIMRVSKNSAAHNNIHTRHNRTIYGSNSFTATRKPKTKTDHPLVSKAEARK